jgi:hypothetical protein
MHIGVIRGDLPGPILLAGLEPVSQYNPPTEARGQEVYISRPTTGEIEAVLADATVGAGACINGIGDLSGAFPITITNGVDDNLRFRLAGAPAPFVDVDIAAGAYANITDLLAAVNTALANASVAVTAFLSVSPGGADQRITFESDTKGVGSFVELDSVAGGSTANAPLLTPDGQIRTMAPATDFIADCLPVGGPLDVSTATINAVGGAGTNLLSLLYIPVARGTQAAVANAIAPQVGDTPVAIDSFIAGDLSQLLNANFNPDPRRVPPLVAGAAIEVSQADGTTPFAAAVPAITSATLDTPAVGDVTIAGTDMAAQGDPQAERSETTVKFIGAGTPPGGDMVLTQAIIEANGGFVTATQIIIPLNLNPFGYAVTTTSCQVQYRSFASNVQVLV